MKIDGRHYVTIWINEGKTVSIIDQTKLPHQLNIVELKTLYDAEFAIKTMQVRGAPLIGITAAYGISFQCLADAQDTALKQAAERLIATRPTAVNLKWAVNIMLDKLLQTPTDKRFQVAFEKASYLAHEDIKLSESIGEHGADLLNDMYKKKGKSGAVNVLTHCNAGWLATVDWGTALAPIYKAHDLGIPVHVWVDETRPRNQGASLTAFELKSQGIPHTVIVDNAGGHLMQHGLVDICIVGADRVSAKGDVCNKVGTYLKALAAKDNHIPFYAAMPYSTIDWSITDGVRDIPIEERDSKEVTHIYGKNESGEMQQIQLTPDDTRALNIGFDVTPNTLITGLITEKGLISPSMTALKSMYHNEKTKEVSNAV